MKKCFIVAFLLPVILTANIGVRAQDKLPPQLQYIDAQLAVFYPVLQEYEKEYFDNNKGEYFQALGSHKYAPATADVATDIKNHPTDQDTDLGPLWDMAGLPASMNWMFTINVSKSEAGPGYSLVVDTTIKGITWERMYSMDSEKRSVEWQIVPPVPEP